MKKSRMISAMVATMATAVFAEVWGGNTAPAAYVSLDTESTAIWRTAFADTLTLRWEKPPTATKAELTVSGVAKTVSAWGIYFRHCDDIVTNRVSLRLKPGAKDARPPVVKDDAKVSL